uniref:Olfactory receptor 14A16 n=1 Tax=Columba livia TaxID=8932 RepID=R7VQ22_COLLI
MNSCEARSSCPQAANIQQQLHHPVPPLAVHRHTGAAARALLALPGHLAGCPPGQRPHHHHHSQGPAPPHPHVLLPAQPLPPRPYLGSITTILPKSMANSLWDTRAISYAGCVAQLFLFVFSISTEYCLLSIMSYDCYVAICKPLHYGTLLGSRACVHMAAAAWATVFLNALLHTANTFSLPLCKGNALGQFFCEIPQILKLSCSHSYLRELGLLMFSAFFFEGFFVFIVVSYVQILRAVLRIPSEQGRHKAFSTCLPHLAVVLPCLPT